jgi:hypothetical protein
MALKRVDSLDADAVADRCGGRTAANCAAALLANQFGGNRFCVCQ